MIEPGAVVPPPLTMIPFSTSRAVWGLVLRDLRVLRRNLGPFVVRTIMNPMLFVFVFTYVLPRIGQGVAPGPGGATYATVIRCSWMICRNCSRSKRGMVTIWAPRRRQSFSTTVWP